MKVLVVEDEPRIATDVATALKAAGMAVDVVTDGEEAWFRGDTESYDAAILDLGLPKLDGLTVLKRWRANGDRFPVLILTARGVWTERVEGINAGADDYLPKPFEMEELVARLRALLRRSAGQAAPVLNVGPLSLDTRQMRISLRGKPVALSPLEYRLLAFLMHHAGRVVAPTELAEHLYDFGQRSRPQRDRGDRGASAPQARQRRNRNAARLRLSRPGQRGMKGGSIRLRLWSAAALSILIALTVAGVGLRYLFERHVERRVESDLSADLIQLIGATSYTNGTMQVAPIFPDPRMETPLSGYYWQVEDLATGTLVRSRSLWDSALTVPQQPDGALHHYEISGPRGTLLVTVARTIADPGGRSFRVTVAEDHQTVEESVTQYMRELWPSLALLGAVLLAAIFVQITVGLAPLEHLRAAVREVIARRSTRLEVAAPREVQPLADEINRLLEAQEKALARARSSATDLAHGLKTPLQVLSADIRALRNKGEAQLADDIERSAGAIRRHVERELARARLAPGVSGAVECRVAETAARVISVVKRTPGGERLAFSVDVPEDLTAPIDEGDLSEVLGNVIENAARFARSSIRVRAWVNGNGATITVSDDGPGIADSDKVAALSRGVRLDSNGGGTGLGLAIVSDIVAAYGGELTMADAGPGLQVTISLPRQA